MSYFHHHNGFDVNTFYNNKKLMEFFYVLNTNFDLNNREFISTVEAKEYPFYGL